MTKKRTHLMIMILLLLVVLGILYHMHGGKVVRVERYEEPVVPMTPPAISPPVVSPGAQITPMGVMGASRRLIVGDVPMTSVSGIERGPKEIDAIDRFWNPLRYPMRNDYFYEQNWYPELNLPFQVIGGGARNGPTLGGTQIPIANPNQPLSVSNANIAPVNITTRGPRGQPQQVGIIYKLNASPNEYLPLFGMKEYPNSNHYLYYTVMGHNSNIKVPVFGSRRMDEIGNNDLVRVQGQSEPYRVSIYESNFPQYVPYL